ncbi:MAG TPA: hypothetical protein VFZ27_13400 [Terriglobia bacterium]|nr:hypothetical protein [Terriglobia bacterium]
MNQVTPKFVREFARIAALVLAVWVPISPAGSLSARPRKLESRLAVKVAVYNDAHIDRVQLYDAERQAAALFADAGLKIVWLDYSHRQRRVSCQPEISSTDFFLRIVTATGTLPQGSEAEAMGRSMIPPAGYGYVPCGTASVFYDRVMAFASAWDPNSQEILGDAMAHELGHLLLGIGHSPQGIMKAFWTFQDLDLAKRGKLRFSPEELAMFQRTAQSLPRNSSTMAAAQH